MKFSAGTNVGVLVSLKDLQCKYTCCLNTTAITGLLLLGCHAKRVCLTVVDAWSFKLHGLGKSSMNPCLLGVSCPIFPAVSSWESLSCPVTPVGVTAPCAHSGSPSLHAVLGLAGWAHEGWLQVWCSFQIAMGSANFVISWEKLMGFFWFLFL